MKAAENHRTAGSALSDSVKQLAELFSKTFRPPKNSIYFLYAYAAIMTVFMLDVTVGSFVLPEWLRMCLVSVLSVGGLWFIFSPPAREE